jgi:hemerythrin-like domain-containing protein
MALLHNAILRGYNSIYRQAPHVQDEDKADFIGYALTWYKFVKSHHDDEEENLFTKVEQLLEDKDVFAETHLEHGTPTALQTLEQAPDSYGTLTRHRRVLPPRPR